VSSVDPGNNPTWNFTYNAPGHRAQWAYGSSGAADQHLFDPAGNWLGIWGSYNLVHFGDRALVVSTGSATFFNHANHLGSTSMFTNHTGTNVFIPTKIQSDENGNFQGHTVSFDTSGIHVDSKCQGVFASGTDPTVVNGSGLLAGFQMTVNGIVLHVG
jgi:hypothetical protein